MLAHLVRITGCILALQLLTGCAQIGTLTGGKRDVNPPQLLEAIPANKSTEFTGREVTLRFDEFIKITGLSEQLIITPKLEKPPEITAEGKKIRIYFKEVLPMPNTTYRFYFGSSIADMHESNVLKNFEYIVSTGNFIDSLKIKGRVTEAFDNTSAPGVIVGLYNYSGRKDSLPFKVVPDYLTRTADDGSFELGYLPEGSFEVYTFLDKNKNYLYDGESEKVGYNGPSIMLPGDTTLNLKLFQEESPKTYIKKTAMPYLGLAQIILNKKSNVAVTALNLNDKADIFEAHKGKEKDTVLVFYKNLKDTFAVSLKNKLSGKTDTIRLALPSSNKQRRLKNITTNASGGKLALKGKLKLEFPVWMDTLRFDNKRLKLRYKSDTVNVVIDDVKGHWTGINAFELNNTLIEGKTYTLILDTNAFFTVNGLGNDSIRFDFKTQSKSELGKLTVKMKVYRKQNYIVQLINEQQKVVREELVSFSLSSSNAVSIDFIDVLPGSYTFKVVFDNNENKKWDGGDISIKKLPEQVFINPKQIKVLSDWEVEEEIVVKE